MLEGVHSLMILGMGDLRDIIYILEIAPAIEKSPVYGVWESPKSCHSERRDLLFGSRYHLTRSQSQLQKEIIVVHLLIIKENSIPSVKVNGLKVP